MTLQTAAQIWRDYETDGVPGSGAHQVQKRDVKLWGQMFEQMLQVNRLGFATLALLNADLAHNANELAIVYADATAANNGTWQKSGASGTGSWTRIGDLPGNLVVLTVTGGTGNAITATAIETPQQPGAKLYLLVPGANNTGATTIAVNGGAVVPITNAFNSALASGSLIAGNQALMSWQTDHYQLMIAAAVDGNAILASAVAARDAAIAAAAAAAIATAADRTALKALDTTLFKSCNLREAGREGTFAWKTGNFASLVTADAQEGIYVKANAIASSSGAWVRVREDDRINVLWFGAAGYTAAAAAYSLAGTIGGVEVVWPGNTTYDLGSNALSVPDGIDTDAARTAIIRRSADPAGATPYSAYTSAMIVLGNYCTWKGGQLDNSAVLTTSTSSNSIGTVGTKTFTVAAGLGLTTSSFLRIYSRANPANHMEGTVSSYSGTTLIVGGLFANGSGTFTDWDICFGAVYQCPIVLHGVIGSSVEGVRVTGKWYVGLLMDGWNVSGSTALQVRKCAFRGNLLEGVMNRSLYVYGYAVGCNIQGNFILGGSGTTDYGINLNPANATGSSNIQVRTLVADNDVEGCAFQGIAPSDQCLYNVIEGNRISSLTNAASVGVLEQFANGISPQYNSIRNNVVNNSIGTGFSHVGVLNSDGSGNKAVVCGVSLFFGPSGGTQTQFVKQAGFSSSSSTTIGVQVAGNSNRIMVKDVSSLSSGSNGVQIDSGATNTIVDGLSLNSTGSNLVNNGTGSTISGLQIV